MSMKAMTLKIDDVVPSPDNRKHHDVVAMIELEQSVAEHGILQPLIVLAIDGNKYEVVAGERRLKAAQKNELKFVPALLFEGTAQEARHVRIVENLQRENLHPIDEADAIIALLKDGRTAEKIAAAIGKHVGYVRERARLANLSTKARQLLITNKITMAHALALARIGKTSQDAAISEALFEDEQLLLAPDDDNRTHLKVVTVGELQGWIDKHVRLGIDDHTLQDLFPETAAVVGKAQHEKVKTYDITHEHQVHPDARDGKRILGPYSWKAVEPESCDYVAVGVFVVGACRGQSTTICVEKKKCTKHWPVAKAPTKSADAATTSTSNDAARKQNEEWEKKQAREREARERWILAKPALAKAIEKACLEPEAGDALATIVMKEIVEGHKLRAIDAGKGLPALIRNLGNHVLQRCAANEWRGPDELPALAKSIGLDVKKIIDDAVAKKAAAKSKASADGVKAAKKNLVKNKAARAGKKAAARKGKK